MSRRKNKNKQRLIGELFDEYNIDTATDIQEALKDLLGLILESIE